MESLTDQVWQDIQTWANEKFQDTGISFPNREEMIKAYWDEKLPDDTESDSGS